MTKTENESNAVSIPQKAASRLTNKTGKITPLNIERAITPSKKNDKKFQTTRRNLLRAVGVGAGLSLGGAGLLSEGV